MPSPDDHDYDEDHETGWRELEDDAGLDDALDPPWGQPPPCTCGPDLTGEGPDERPDCPLHGVDRQIDLDPRAEAPF